MALTQVRHLRWWVGVVLCFSLRVMAQNAVLQPLGDKPVAAKQAKLSSADYYVPATPDTVRWGHLPNNEAKPILSVPSGAMVTFDTISHEGILEDQGRDPVKYFGTFGVTPETRAFPPKAGWLGHLLKQPSIGSLSVLIRI